jgi:hypothetical protein
MRHLKKYETFILEYYGDDFYTEPAVPFDNTPFFGSNEITAKGGDGISPTSSDSPGKEPKQRKTGKRKTDKEKTKPKKLHFSIDQDDYKYYMKTKKPGKAFI